MITVQVVINFVNFESKSNHSFNFIDVTTIQMAGYFGKLCIKL